MHGVPDETICRVAEDEDAAIVVVGARGTRRGTAPVGSTSRSVVQHARRPVLVAHEDDAFAGVDATLGLEAVEVR